MKPFLTPIGFRRVGGKAVRQVVSEPGGHGFESRERHREGEIVGPGVPPWIWLHNATPVDCSKNRFAGAMSNAIKDLIETLPTTNWF